MRIMPGKRRKRCKSKHSRGVLRGKCHISERPAKVELCQEPGHWEGDTVFRVNKRFSILTLVERRSGFAIIKKLKAHISLQVNAAANQAISEHGKMFSPITFDAGTEFHDCKQLEARFSIGFCLDTPYNSWKRGSIENLNGLIGQCVPKGACMKLLTQDQWNKIAADLKARPRKRSGFDAPSEIWLCILAEYCTSALKRCAVLLLAAGMGRRFGGARQKCLAPLHFGEGPMQRLLRQLTLSEARLRPYVVTGHDGEAAACIFNPAHADGSLLVSLAAGLARLPEDRRLSGAWVLFGDAIHQLEALERILSSRSVELTIACQPHSGGGDPPIGPRFDPRERQLQALGPDLPTDQGLLAPAVYWPRSD